MNHTHCVCSSWPENNLSRAVGGVCAGCGGVLPTYTRVSHRVYQILSWGSRMSMSWRRTFTKVEGVAKCSLDWNAQAQIATWKGFASAYGQAARIVLL